MIAGILCAVTLGLAGAAKPSPGTPGCHGATARDYNKLARKSWGLGRWRDASPVRRSEHRRLRHMRGCVEHPRKTVAYWRLAKRRFERAWHERIDPPGAAYLASVRSCESGSSGGYSANTGNGFYGAYQFDLQTWGSVGGHGLPSDARPREQDYRAAKLYRQRGSAPWPKCG